METVSTAPHADAQALYVGEPIDGRRLPFPGGDRFSVTWSAIATAARTYQSLDTHRFLMTFCGAVGNDTWRHVRDAIDGVHHVAFYLGDYEREEQVFDWLTYLEELHTKKQLQEVNMGPSYIAPKEYGTPGWWYSVTLPDGLVAEMFTCRAFRNWAERSPQERVSLMSHVGILIKRENEVYSSLQILSRANPAIETIAYVEEDEVGHTYGHLRNNREQRVVELVHQAPR